MPVYLSDSETEVPTSTKCGTCGGTLTVRVDSAGHRITAPCIKCLDARKRTYGNIKT